MKKIKRKLLYFCSFIFAVCLNCIFFILEKGGLRYLQSVLVGKIVKLFGENIYSERREYSPLRGETIINVIIAIPSKGCQYFFETGGCAMCGFNNEIKKYKFNQVHSQVIVLLTKIFVYYLKDTYTEKNYFSMLSIFMAGSFVNVNELPKKSQEIIINYFLESSFDKLFIESRVEYVIDYISAIRNYKSKINSVSKNFEIALGLESSNDYIRNEIIKKGVEKNDFQKAVILLKELGIVVSTYVLVGNPYSSEKEILESSLKTIEYAWFCNVDIANIEIYCVQERTPWTYLYKKGVFKPISLWTVIEMLKHLEKMPGKWRLGEFADWPKPLACPVSCDQCNEGLLLAINGLRMTHEFDEVLNLNPCNCQLNGGK